MRYLVLLVGDGDEPAWGEQSEAEQGAAMAKFGAFSKACADREGVELIAGEALSEAADAVVMRTTGGVVQLTDGPYAEVIEGMGGFYLMDAAHLDVVVELLRILPSYDIQIHPTVDVTV